MESYASYDNHTHTHAATGSVITVVSSHTHVQQTDVQSRHPGKQEWWSRLFVVAVTDDSCLHVIISISISIITVRWSERKICPATHTKLSQDQTNKTKSTQFLCDVKEVGQYGGPEGQNTVTFQGHGRVLWNVVVFSGTLWACLVFKLYM